MNSHLTPALAHASAFRCGPVAGRVLSPRQSGVPAHNGLSSGVMTMSNVQSGTAIITSHVTTAAPAKPVYTPARVLKMDLDGALSRRIVSAVAAAEGTNGATETTANISGRALRMEIGRAHV